MACVFLSWIVDRYMCEQLRGRFLNNHALFRSISLRRLSEARICYDTTTNPNIVLVILARNSISNSTIDWDWTGQLGLSRSDPYTKYSASRTEIVFGEANCSSFPYWQSCHFFLLLLYTTRVATLNPAPFLHSYTFRRHADELKQMRNYQVWQHPQNKESKSPRRDIGSAGVEPSVSSYE